VDRNKLSFYRIHYTVKYCILIYYGKIHRDYYDYYDYKYDFFFPWFISVVLWSAIWLSSPPPKWHKVFLCSDHAARPSLIHEVQIYLTLLCVCGYLVALLGLSSTTTARKFCLCSADRRLVWIDVPAQWGSEGNQTPPERPW